MSSLSNPLSAAPDRYVEVDAARLLLILSRFSDPADSLHRPSSRLPRRPWAFHFSPQYRLHKLDFLLRYPGYLAYELIELCRRQQEPAPDRAEVISIIRSIISNREPELSVLPFRKFRWGAYESIDDVEAWWYSRGLVYIEIEQRGDSPARKHYFTTAKGVDTATRLADEVSHAGWYAKRLDLIYRFFGHMSASEIKELQYSHPAYKQAQLDEAIPNLSEAEIAQHFFTVFGEDLELGAESGEE